VPCLANPFVLAAAIATRHPKLMHLLVLLLFTLAYVALPCHAAENQAAKAAPSVRKLRDITIYSHDKFYCAFPSIVARREGELIVAFRRAPERRAFGETGITHTDANAYLMLTRSTDSGQTWSTPELLFAIRSRGRKTRAWCS